MEDVNLLELHRPSTYLSCTLLWELWARLIPLPEFVRHFVVSGLLRMTYFANNMTFCVFFVVGLLFWAQAQLKTYVCKWLVIGLCYECSSVWLPEF